MALDTKSWLFGWVFFFKYTKSFPDKSKIYSNKNKEKFYSAMTNISDPKKTLSFFGFFCSVTAFASIFPHQYFSFFVTKSNSTSKSCVIKSNL